MTKGFTPNREHLQYEIMKFSIYITELETLIFNKPCTLYAVENF
jgi:hypothetical protein